MNDKAKKLEASNNKIQELISKYPSCNITYEIDNRTNELVHYTVVGNVINENYDSRRSADDNRFISMSSYDGYVAAKEERVELYRSIVTNMHDKHESLKAKFILWMAAMLIVCLGLLTAFIYVVQTYC